MSTSSILYPLLAQVALTFILMLRMGRLRVGAIRRRKVRFTDIALGQQVWPDNVQQASNAFRNQFELPVLFYLIIVLVIVTRAVDGLMVLLAWLFVLARLAHAWIHVTHNNVQHRFYAFLAGALLLVAMWGVFAWRVFSGVIG